jgi:hypothetical protein
MPSQIQSKLPEYTLEQVGERLNRSRILCGQEPRSLLDQKTIYLALQCARGDVEKVKSFIRETDRHELVEILNNRPTELFCGNVLHVVLFWNSDYTAVDLFDLLVQHGAEYTRNYYEECPWEQVGQVWFTMFAGPELPGKRNLADFEEVYQIIRETYEIAQYEETTPIQEFWQRAAEEIPV